MPLTGSVRELGEGLRCLAQLVGLERGPRRGLRFPRNLPPALPETGQYPLDAELELVQSVRGGDLMGPPHGSRGAPEMAEARLTDPFLQIEVRAHVRWHVVQARLALLPPTGESHTVAAIRGTVHQFDHGGRGVVVAAAAPHDLRQGTFSCNGVPDRQERHPQVTERTDAG